MKPRRMNGKMNLPNNPFLVVRNRLNALVNQRLPPNRLLNRLRAFSRWEDLSPSGLATTSPCVPFSVSCLPPSQPKRGTSRGRSTERRQILNGIIQPRPGANGDTLTSPTVAAASIHTIQPEPELPGASPSADVMARFGGESAGAGGSGGGDDDGSDHPASVDDQDWKDVKRKQNKKETYRPGRCFV